MAQFICKCKSKKRIKDLEAEVKSLEEAYDKLRKEFHYMMS